jgi:hypothetical protein
MQKCFECIARVTLLIAMMWTSSLAVADELSCAMRSLGILSRNACCVHHSLCIAHMHVPPYCHSLCIAHMHVPPHCHSLCIAHMHVPPYCHSLCIAHMHVPPRCLNFCAAVNLTRCCLMRLTDADRNGHYTLVGQPRASHCVGRERVWVARACRDAFRFCCCESGSGARVRLNFSHFRSAAAPL